MTIGLDETTASLTTLAAFRIGESDIGKSVFVTDTGVGDTGAWYQAMAQGRGLDKWRRSGTDHSTSGTVRSYYRLYDHADADVALVATSAAIALGDVTPTNAMVLSIHADVTEDWTDGAAGTFTADVGDGTDADAFTPTALDIDNGIAVLGSQVTNLPASAKPITVTFSSSVNLSTATAGKLALTVYFVVPDQQDLSV